jgi:hypothetical protein
MRFVVSAIGTISGWLEIFAASPKTDPELFQKRVNSGETCVSRDRPEMSLPNPSPSELILIVFNVEVNGNLLPTAFKTPISYCCQPLHERFRPEKLKYQLPYLTVESPIRLVTMAEPNNDTAKTPSSASKRTQANPKESGKKARPCLTYVELALIPQPLCQQQWT